MGGVADEMSSCPSGATVSSIACWQSCRLVRSPSMTMPARPSSSIASRVSSASRFSAGSAVIATSAPSRASVSTSRAARSACRDDALPWQIVVDSSRPPRAAR